MRPLSGSMGAAGYPHPSPLCASGLVRAAQLAVVPGRHALGGEADRDALGGLGAHGLRSIALDGVDAVRVADGQVLAEAEHALRVADDLGFGLDLNAAELHVLLPGLDQERRPRVAL